MVSTQFIWESLGVGITVIGSIGNALGYVLQKKGHLENIEENEIAEITDSDPQSLISNKTWLIGFFVCLAGSIVTASALNFGPQSVLGPHLRRIYINNNQQTKIILFSPIECTCASMQRIVCKQDSE